jgi:hypothetical protein
MRIAMNAVLWFALAIAFASSAAEPEVALAREGESQWRIFVPKSAGQTERFAAGEFRKYFGRISGAEITMIGNFDGEKTIFIGLRQELGKVDLPDAKPGSDGYRISVSAKNIVIAGETPRGVLYGVYDLLERLGCRWYQPTLDPKDPEVVPSNRNPALPQGSWSEAGKIELRVFNGSAFFFELKPEWMLPQIDWAAKNRYNGISWQAHHTPGSVGRQMEEMKNCGALAELDKRGLFLHGPCHSFPFFLSTDRYFKEHPEWFGLYKGERRKHGEELPLMNYCWSNPDANREFIRNVVAFLGKYPQYRIFCPVPIDGGKACECEKCQQRGAPNLLVELFNQLADELEKSSPGVTVEMVLGYGPAEHPPHDAKPNGKWSGLYAHWGRNHQQSYNDSDYARRSNLTEWASHFSKMGICSYYAAASHQPFNGPPFLRALEGDMDYLVGKAVREHYILQYPHNFWWNYSFDLAEAGLYSYYYPKRKPREQLQDYISQYFGKKSAPLLAQFFARLAEDLELSYRASRGDGSIPLRKQLDELRKMIREAQAVEKEPPYSYRLGKLLASHDMLRKWGGGLSHLKKAEAKLVEFEKQKGGREEVQEAVDFVKTYARELLDMAAAVEKKYPGVMQAEWLENWYVKRTLLEPLARLEAKLPKLEGTK